MIALIKTAFAGIIVIALSVGFHGCGREKIHQGEKAMQQKSIEEVLKTHTPNLMSIPGVIGTAIGEQKGESCIIVLVIEKTSELTGKIPSTIEGFPVIIKQTGEIRALDQH